MFDVRKDLPRINMDGGRGGAMVVIDQLCAVKSQIVELASSLELEPVAYGDRSEFCETIAYRKPGQGPRQESLLVDDGGMWFSKAQFGESWEKVCDALRRQHGLGRILSIVVRDSDGINADLTESVRSILNSNGVNLEAATLQAPGAIIFALTPLDPREIVMREVEDVLQGLIVPPELN